MTRVWILCLLAASCLPPPPREAPHRERSNAPSAEPRVEKRSVASTGRTSGYLQTTTKADGTIEVVFHVLENGRGPHTEATFQLADDWTIAGYAANGKHTMGTKVTETFVRS